MDGTGAAFATGALRGKLGGTFFSTGSQVKKKKQRIKGMAAVLITHIQHGGQETTALTTVTYFAHQGMIYVPLGFPAQLNDMSEIVGGSAYGAGTVAGGDGSREPSAKELEIAHIQGKSFGDVIKAYVRGKNAFAVEEQK